MKFEQQENNKVFLTGIICSEAKESHESFGEMFYEIDLKVKRLSDQFDIIPIIVSDVNTKATAKRKITLTIEFIPDDERTSIGINVAAKSTLAPTYPVNTLLHVTSDRETGELMLLEATPQIPGQIDLSNNEQRQPKIMKFAK